MPTGAEHPDAGDELDLAVHLGQLPGCPDRIELLDFHDPLHAKLVAVRRLRLVALDDVARVRERRPPGGVDHAARMVVVKVSHDDEIDGGGILADGPQRLDWVAALDALDVAVLLGHPHAGARLYEDALAVGLDEEQVQTAEDSAALVGLDEAAPQRPGDDAEERARVGPKPAGSH